MYTYWWEKIIIGACAILCIGVMVGCIVVCVAGTIWTFSPQKARRDAEWQQKVDNCVLNENFRKDCKLILHKDMQINNQRYTGVAVMPVVVR